MGSEFHAASLDRFGRGIQEKADAAWLEPVRAGGAPCADRLGGSTAYRFPKQTTCKPCRIPFGGYRYASGATGSGAQRTLAAVACKPSVRHRARARTLGLPTNPSPSKGIVLQTRSRWSGYFQTQDRRRATDQACPYRRFHCGKLCCGKYASFSEQLCAWDRDQVLRIKHPRAQKARRTRHFKA